MMLEEGPLSDTTASAPGSDDELGSNAATDGSTLRTSPAEHGGSAGSESGGSAVDSMSGERERDRKSERERKRGGEREGEREEELVGGGGVERD